jgi:hypothetical protein
MWITDFTQDPSLINKQLKDLPVNITFKDDFKITAILKMEAGTTIFPN